MIKAIVYFFILDVKIKKIFINIFLFHHNSYFIKNNIYIIFRKEYNLLAIH
jgi:hypothetical protein